MRWRPWIAVFVSLLCFPSQGGSQPAADASVRGAAKLRPALVGGIAGEYIVVLKDGVARDPLRPGSVGPPVAEVARRLAARYGGVLERSYEHALSGFSIHLPDEAAARLAADPAVELVEQNAVVATSTVDSCDPAHAGLAVEARNPIPFTFSTTPQTQPIDCPDPDPVRRNGDPSGATPYYLSCIDNWGLDVLDGARFDGYNFSLTGQGVHVYLIDFGINASHQEFGARVKRGFNAAAHDSDSDEIKNDFGDCVGNSHGTHVAAIVAGNTFGVAKRAWIHPVKFEDACRPGRSGSRNTVINAVDWILRHHNRQTAAEYAEMGPPGPGVVNFSGGNGADASFRDGVMALWVRRLLTAGIPLVQSAGNQDNRDRVVPNNPPVPQNACLNTLAHHDELRDGLIVVGGIDETGPLGGKTYHRWVRESGDPSYPLCEPDSRHDCGSNYNSCVDIWAPAAHIVSAKNSDTTSACRLSGTSMAAPHVTGAVALLLQRFPDASPSAIRKALLASARTNVLEGSPTLGDSPNRLLRTTFPLTGAPIAGDRWFNTPPGAALVIFKDDLLRGSLDWDGHALSLSQIGLDDPTGGELIEASDRLTYLPNGGFTGVDSFSYTVSDGHGGSATAPVHIEVKQQPQPPIARDDCYETPLNTNLILNPADSPPFLANDTDPDGDLESWSQQANSDFIQQPALGEVGQLSYPFSTDFFYRPKPDTPGIDTFKYFRRDAFYQQDEAIVTIYVGSGTCPPPPNQPPTPQDDAFTTPFNTSFSFLASTLVANDTDPDNDALFFDGLGSQLPAHGFLAVDGVGPEDIIYRYVPNAGFIGTDSFVYQVRDAGGLTATATVHITGTSAGFFGNPDTFITTIDTRLRVLASQLTANDSPGAVFIRAENPRNGDLTIAGIGPEDIVYDFYPASGFVGEAGFEYLISPNGNEPYTRINVTVQVVDGPPVAGFTASCAGAACSFDASRSDDDVGIASYAWSFGDGATATSMTASHTYAPGTYAVNLTVTDTAGLTATDDRLVLADPLPVAAFTFSCTGRTCSFDASGSTDNAGIVSYGWIFGDGTTGSGVTASHTYTASGNFSVTLTVTDTVGQTDTETRTVTIDLNPTACFTAVRDGLVYTFNASCSSDDLGIAGYAWSFGDGTTGTGNPITHAYATSGPRTATLTVTDTGAHAASTSQTVNPDAKPVANFTWSCTLRTCTFDCTGSTDNGPIVACVWSFGDGTTGSGPTVSHTYAAGGPKPVTLTVTDTAAQTNSKTSTVAVNRPPAAAADTAVTDRNVAIDINVLANDADPDGHPLTVSWWSQPGHGTVTKNANGTMRYTPAAGYTGPDGFTYRASDGQEESATVAVALTVRPPNNPPDARDDSWSTYQNGPTNIPTSHLLANDYDPNGDALTVTGVNTAGLSGTLDCSFGTYCRYTPLSWFVGVTSFTYSANDGKGGTDPATVRVKVGTVNGAPAPQDDILETAYNTPLTFTRATLLVNDSDPDGDVLSVTSVYRAPLTALGTVSCSAANYVCTYTPPAGFTGVDVLSYRASDGITFLDAKIRILVRPANPAVLDAREDQTFFTTVGGTFLSYTWMTSNDYDPEGGPLTVIGVDTAGLLGTLDCTTFATGCEYIRGTSDPTRFRYTVRDPQGNLATTTVTLKPGNWSFNQAPVIANDQLSTRTNQPLVFSVFDVLRNDYDPDNDQLDVSFYFGSPSGQVACSTPAYTCTYTPNANFTGTDTLTYIANDRNNMATGSVTVTVQPVLAKDARFVSQSIPVSMFAGQSYPVSIRVKNVGTTSWSLVGPQCNAFRLGSVNPYDNFTWGSNRSELPATVAPGADISLTFTVTAPSTPGTYNLQRRMVHECVEWFGDLSPNVVVTVSP